MNLKDKYQSLLSFFDGRKYDLDEVAQILDKIVTVIKEKGGFHQAGCAWAIAMLYKHGKCNPIQIEDTIDEFNEYCKDYDNYMNSLVIGDKTEAPLTFYNGFIDKKIKGV